MLVRNYGSDHKIDERMDQIPFMFNVSRSRLTTNHDCLCGGKNNRPGEKKRKSVFPAFGKQCLEKKIEYDTP